MPIDFDDFSLDADRYCLERRGVAIALRPKVFDLLVHLVRHRDRVVRREELIGVVWGRTAVGAGSLSGLVNELRQALGETGRGPSSIRTVHARGYQFVARVKVERPEAGGRGRPRPRVSDTVAGRREGSRAFLRRVASDGCRGLSVSREDSMTRRLLMEEARRSGFEIGEVRLTDSSPAEWTRLALSLIGWASERFGRSTVSSQLLPHERWILDSAARSDSISSAPLVRQAKSVAGNRPATPNATSDPWKLAAAVLEGASARKPLLLWIDGIEQADPNAPAMISRWLGRLGDAPIGLVLSVEPAQLDTASPENFSAWRPNRFPPAARSTDADAIDRRLRRVGLPPFPESLRRAIVDHVGSERAVCDALDDWLEPNGRGASPPTTSPMLRVGSKATHLRSAQPKSP